MALIDTSKLPVIERRPGWHGAPTNGKAIVVDTPRREGFAQKP